MLKNAVSYADELQDRMRETWYDLKYQYYHAGGLPRDLEFDQDYRWTFVSVDEYDYVVGMISFQIATDTNCVRNFGVISFNDGLNPEFASDIAQIVDDIFNKYHFNRMEWYCVDGNPALKSYKKFCEKHGGTIVAHEHECVKTLDGKIRDAYAFEILSRNYIPIKRKVV